jgi:hypothetical protein
MKTLVGYTHGLAGRSADRHSKFGQFTNDFGHYTIERRKSESSLLAEPSEATCDR